MEAVSNKQRREELNQALELLKPKQEERLVIDFDEALEEYRQQNAPIVVRFNGKEYEVQRDAPAETVLWIIRNTEEGMLSDKNMYEFLRKVLGKEFLEEIENAQAPMTLVASEVTTRILKEWNLGNPQGYIEEKKPKSPGS